MHFIIISYISENSNENFKFSSVFVIVRHFLFFVFTNDMQSDTIKRNISYHYAFWRGSTDHSGVFRKGIVERIQ